MTRNIDFISLGLQLQLGFTVTIRSILGGGGGEKKFLVKKVAKFATWYSLSFIFLQFDYLLQASLEIWSVGKKMRFKAKNGAIREMSSEGENLVSKSGQIHEIERIKLKSMLNQKVIKFAGVSVLSMRVHCRGRRLGLRLMFSRPGVIRSILRSYITR